MRLKIVTTSWDDGHKLDIKLSHLLNKYKIASTIYVSPRNREWKKSDLLSNNQIKSLSNYLEIGAHTMTHPVLTAISQSEAYKEIKDSKIYLEKLLAKEVKMFAYPKGQYNQNIKELTKIAGFLGARTINTYRTAPPNDFFKMGTTNHSVNRSVSRSLLLSLANNFRFIPYSFYNDWVSVSCKTFDIVQKYGGIWHFWGHSWQIEENDWWESLEKVLKYVSKRSGFYYLTNGDILEYLNKLLRTKVRSILEQ